LSSLVDASLGLRVRPFVEGLLAVSHPEDPPLTSLAEGRGMEVLSAFENQGCSPHAAKTNKVLLSTFVPGLTKNSRLTLRASVAYLTDHDRKTYLSTAARVSVLEMIFSAFDGRDAKNCHFNKKERRFWAVDFDTSMFDRFSSINMTYINKSTLACARDMWKVPDTPFPMCEFFWYMAASLSDVHYGTLSDDLYMRIKQYNVFAFYLQPRFSNNASECLKEFNGAMPFENMAQGPISLQNIQVQALDRQNVSCRVDVQRVEVQIKK
jgi:hypothetical protein